MRIEGRGGPQRGQQEAGAVLRESPWKAAPTEDPKGE